MKVPRTHLIDSKFWIICGVLGVASISHSVHPQTNVDAKKTPAASNAGPAAVAPPQSVFTIPRTPQEGLRDPFFPRSSRIFANAPAPVVTTTKEPVVIHVELKLQGISGPPNHRLPIINGRTFEVGEEAEVNTTSGRVALRCVEVKGDTVIVIVNGDRRELKLRQGL
jgi:hypothetical protein